MTKMKVSLAAWLRHVAQKLDPQPNMVTTRPIGGWTIEFQGVPLAVISTGQISTKRLVDHQASSPKGTARGEV